MTQPPTPQWDPQAGRWVLPEQGQPQGYAPTPGHTGQGQHGQGQHGQQAWQGQQATGYAPPGQGYGQPSGQWPPQPPRVPTKKKRKKWPFVVGGILLLLIIIVSTSNGGTTTPTQAAGTAPATTAPAAGAAAPAGTDATTSEQASSGVVYTVTGSGKSNNITYGGLSKGISQENGKRLPWTKTVSSSDGFESYSLTAQSGSGDGEISCKISVDGKEIASNTSSGQYAVVSCSGTSSPF